MFGYGVLWKRWLMRISVLPAFCFFFGFTSLADFVAFADIFFKFGQPHAVKVVQVVVVLYVLLQGVRDYGCFAQGDGYPQ